MFTHTTALGSTVGKGQVGTPSVIGIGDRPQQDALVKGWLHDGVR